MIIFNNVYVFTLYSAANVTQPRQYNLEPLTRYKKWNHLFIQIILKFQILFKFFKILFKMYHLVSVYKNKNQYIFNLILYLMDSSVDYTAVESGTPYTYYYNFCQVPFSPPPLIFASFFLLNLSPSSPPLPFF